MATRRYIGALVAVLAMTAGANAAVVKTTNFIVETARTDDAEEFARLAEHYRKTKAMEWLGKEMPNWRSPCRLRVTVTNNGAGGATTFDFNNGQVSQEMQIEGARERLKNSVLPHEITHTVFAHHFRQPVPRWADEGGSVYSEDDLERTRHDKLCKQILNSGEGIQLKALFQMKEYPRQVMTLYAQGYSVTKFLVEQSDRQTFLTFIGMGLHDGWDKAAKEVYNFRNVDTLEQAWLDHLRKVARGEAVVRTPPAPSLGGSNRDKDTKLVMFDTAPPVRPSFDPIPVSRGASPSGDYDRPATTEIGWNRPRAKTAEPVAKPDSNLGPAPAAPSKVYTPAAILLPPEAVPYR
ncbi:peptidase MA family metallohydrolase [Zavarzinella formosa]|uniref:peptidase MA family metallohydrolase n=1 Tax=Zavarzinella formosa TaxID=360055 RepID=UPI0002DF4963|nr:hypothetical protein [Zavarzinella formosa]